MTYTLEGDSDIGCSRPRPLEILSVSSFMISRMSLGASSSEGNVFSFGAEDGTPFVGDWSGGVWDQAIRGIPASSTIETPTRMRDLRLILLNLGA
jgi:hypothetical protein